MLPLVRQELGLERVLEIISPGHCTDEKVEPKGVLTCPAPQSNRDETRPSGPGHSWVSFHSDRWSFGSSAGWCMMILTPPLLPYTTCNITQHIAQPWARSRWHSNSTVVCGLWCARCKISSGRDRKLKKTVSAFRKLLETYQVRHNRGWGGSQRGKTCLISSTEEWRSDMESYNKPQWAKSPGSLSQASSKARCFQNLYLQPLTSLPLMSNFYINCLLKLTTCMSNKDLKFYMGKPKLYSALETGSFPSVLCLSKLYLHLAGC